MTKLDLNVWNNFQMIKMQYWK